MRVTSCSPPPRAEGRGWARVSRTQRPFFLLLPPVRGPLANVRRGACSRCDGAGSGGRRGRGCRRRSRAPLTAMVLLDEVEDAARREAGTQVVAELAGVEVDGVLGHERGDRCRRRRIGTRCPDEGGGSVSRVDQRGAAAVVLVEERNASSTFSIAEAAAGRGSTVRAAARRRSESRRRRSRSPASPRSAGRATWSQGSTVAGRGVSRGPTARSHARTSASEASASCTPLWSAQMVFMNSTASGSPRSGATVAGWLITTPSYRL